jgi:hypothetical protein
VPSLARGPVVFAHQGLSAAWSHPLSEVRFCWTPQVSHISHPPWDPSSPPWLSLGTLPEVGTSHLSFASIVILVLDTQLKLECGPVAQHRAQPDLHSLNSEPWSPALV